MADIYPESRVEEILVATIDGTEYTEYPQSRIEQLLIELKAVIEAGGGGGGTTNYNLLINKPEIAGVELSGNKTLSDLGITQEIKKVMDMLAGQFDPTETYEEGKIVVYNKTLYMFTTDHAAGEFNPLEVEQTDMDRILAAVYNVIPTDLSDLDDDSTHRTVTDTEKSEWNGKQSNVNLTLTPDAVVSDRDVTDGSGNTLSVVADSVSTPKTVIGNPVIVEDALESNADGLVAQIVPIQSGSGDPSPENVRPISGRTSVNLGRDGRNLMLDGLHYTDSSTHKYFGTEIITLKAGTYTGAYTNKSGTTSKLFITQYTDGIGTTIGNITVANNTRGACTFTIAEDADIAIEGRLDPTAVIPSLTVFEDVQLEYGSQATPYEPYITPVTLTIALGTTVYGGTLDVKTGVLTVTHKMVVIDSVDKLTAFATSADFGSYARVVGTTDAKTDSAEVLGLCSKASYVSFNNRLEPSKAYNRVWSDTNNTQVFVRAAYTETVATVADLFAMFEDAQICYELATPQTIQLTGAELALLMGYNRVTSDSGDITLTYKANAVQDLQADKADNADIVDYIENGNKATRAYSANQFMLWKGDLYKVTTSIASGATITAGTNVTKTTIGAVLTALLNA